MQEDKIINHCICCEVNECSHHAGDRDYCTLKEIRVEKHEPNATRCQCTDCASFETKATM